MSAWGWIVACLITPCLKGRKIPISRPLKWGRFLVVHSSFLACDWGEPWGLFVQHQGDRLHHFTINHGFGEMGMLESFTRKPWFAAVALSAAGLSTAASALSLPTTFIKADSVFELSEIAVDALSASGTSISAMGNSFAVASSTQAFDLPVTKVDVSIGLFPPSLKPVSGEAMGSALLISRGSRNLALANFQIDFTNEKVNADIITNGVTTKGVSIYDFDVASPLSIGLSGLTLNMTEKLNHMVLTPEALAAFASALNLNKVLQAPLKTLDFGTINIDIKGALRIPPVSDKPFTVANMPAVPEPSGWALMALGLFGVAAIARSQRRA